MHREETEEGHPDYLSDFGPTQHILIKIHSGICDFLRNDKDLLANNASERSISHKLAEHLQSHFNDLNVDCEYNRHEGAVETLRYSRDSYISHDDHGVFPDIVIHKRGNDRCNIGVIEIKKSNSNYGSYADEQKLLSFTGDEYQYQLGVFLIADINNKSLKIERIFRSGHEITNEIFTMRGIFGHDK